MGKRDRVLSLLPKAFGTAPATAVTPPPVAPSVSSSVPAPQVAASATSSNPALELAIQRCIQRLPEAEKDAFREASKTIDEEHLLSQARSYDETHKQSSFFRPQAERISKFLNFLNRFMGGVAIGIQADPAISSLVVGAVRIVIDLAISFTTFFSRLSDMLCQFEGYLGPLAEYAKGAENQTLVQETVANVYGDLLDFCQRARQVFVDTNGERRKVTSLRLFLRQQWEPFETTFERISTDMQHHLDVLLHATQASQLTLLRSTVEDTEKREKANQRTNFLDWISKLDFEESHDYIFAKRHEATGDWLTQRRDFQEWYGGSSSALLWCYGKPGIGKSVLAANVLEHVTSRRGLNKESAVCFAYYDYRNPELQDPTHIIGALIKQLCRKRDYIPDWLLRFKKDSLSPSTASKEESFVSLAECFQEVFLVIDALDECPKTKRSTVIGFITKVISSLPCAKVFVTSRRESDIVRAFEASNTIQIRADHVTADIEKYVCSEVDKLRHGYHGRKLYLNSDTCERRVISTLTEKADGMFLWVNLQLESLCQVSEARKDRLVEAALDDLPRGLDETYARVIAQIDGQQDYLKDLALNCFSWVFYAGRPLYQGELQHALATNEATKNQADLDLDKIDVILEACGNLLIEEGSVIRPIHFSVHEFFINPPYSVARDSLLANFAEPSSVHTTLARVCLRYMRFGMPKSPSQKPIDLWFHLYNNQLAQYAAQCFDLHVLNCETFPEDIRDLLDVLLCQEEPFLAAILQIRYVQGKFWPMENPIDFQLTSSSVTPIAIIYGTLLYDVPYLRARCARHELPKDVLHSASSLGSFIVVERLLNQGCDVNEGNEQGVRPIHFAARGGHFYIVELLVSKGADVNAQGDAFGSVLQAASVEGHIDIVALILRNGADVNAQGGYYGSALQAASAQGHHDIVKLLFKAGADAGVAGGYYGNALQAASSQGHDDIVEVLLEQGSDPNAPGGYYGNALQAASAHDHNDTISILSSQGAWINGQGGYYGNALQAASKWPDSSTVELLIEKGANIDTQGGYYGNALIAASEYGNDATVELLLDHGADVNAGGGDGQYYNALIAASSYGHCSTVGLLLNKGADINAQGPDGDALQVASAHGNYSTVELLLSKGADVTARAKPHGSALQAASSQGCNNVVELLLSRGADVNGQGGADYGLNTALQAASAEGDDDTVELLIGKGADVNLRGPFGNAVQVASCEGHYETVKLLINAGGDITANSGNRGSALQSASNAGHDEVILLLISNGADINAQSEPSGRYLTALQAASGEGKTSTVALLLDHGANINAQGEPSACYLTALQAASGEGKTHIVELLLDQGADINAHGGRHGDALHAASAHGHNETAELLKSRGTENHENSSPLEGSWDGFDCCSGNKKLDHEGIDTQL